MTLYRLWAVGFVGILGNRTDSKLEYDCFFLYSAFIAVYFLDDRWVELLLVDKRHINLVYNSSLVLVRYGFFWATGKQNKTKPIQSIKLLLWKNLITSTHQLFILVYVFLLTLLLAQTLLPGSMHYLCLLYDFKSLWTGQFKVVFCLYHVFEWILTSLLCEMYIYLS